MRQDPRTTDELIGKQFVASLGPLARFVVCHPPDGGEGWSCKAAPFQPKSTAANRDAGLFLRHLQDYCGVNGRMRVADLADGRDGMSWSETSSRFIHIVTRVKNPGYPGNQDPMDLGKGLYLGILAIKMPFVRDIHPNPSYRS